MSPAERRADEAWREFDAALEPLEWGDGTYVIVVLPDALADAASSARTRRLEGTLDDVEVNVGLARLDRIGPFFYAGPALRRRLGAEVGDAVRCRLRPADPDRVLVPEDVAAALDRAGMRGRFEALGPPARRRLLQPVEAAVRAATRERRVAALVASLRVSDVDAR